MVANLVYTARLSSTFGKNKNENINREIEHRFTTNQGDEGFDLTEAPIACKL
ncbi:hypothetical protein NT6N_24660 [Oceaniferula spumae]|uniref:Uncharacterized protein n=1 Tax=Oceaniferula spumae TaxID=2979115 RepID=A0AAT9FND4_9BACT